MIERLASMHETLDIICSTVKGRKEGLREGKKKGSEAERKNIILLWTFRKTRN